MALLFFIRFRQTSLKLLFYFYTIRYTMDTKAEEKQVIKDILPSKCQEQVKTTKTDVAQHYNAVPETGIQFRASSRIFYLR